MNKMTYFEAQKRASLCIESKNMDSSVAKYLMMERFNFDNTHLLLHYRDEMSLEDNKQYFSDIDKYIEGYPPQYIVSKAPFFGHEFYVDNNVLIPRPETEELVEWVLSDYQNQSNLRLLDMGTGSGAIAIALKLEHPNWQLSAADISLGALLVAQKNAENYNVDINFIHSDLFNKIDNHYEVIVSNPPYIADDELKYMDESVINYEPHEALFADDNGLLMYRKIADHIKKVASKKHGCLYLEIGFKQKNAVVDIFINKVPSAIITTKNDFYGNPRMIRVKY
ncbi:peptide chain release factor N(5)-glutamine methyltransferase [Apilactobacillus apisilvae]|uniref:Release factor glutamine methyltransferase n=1 Tax=Apilactobacillus apisilvae TaxID=2923364 RepID=A0ABY4PHZ9_9LACO|nr:peptide chain release factor N(5)-glutamine methyltransferase [Apilactobacillus apisilvae]UQS85138.1 peptide chain release factor N(5)-glutamine methyltransferase [Apilactobacillus apisilvae]